MASPRKSESGPSVADIQAPPKPEAPKVDAPRSEAEAAPPKADAARTELPKADPPPVKERSRGAELAATLAERTKTDHATTVARVEAKRLADADAVLKSAGITAFKPIKSLGAGATANVLSVRTPRQDAGRAQGTQGRRQRRLRSVVALRAGIFRHFEHRQPLCGQGVRAWLQRNPCLHRHGVFPAGDLRARIARDRPAPEESLIIIGSILSALTSVHAAGIIHRDLKPANVMFRDDGTIALVDFGSARTDVDPMAKTVAGVVIGTPYYLSPEQALGGKADQRSDLYSVGVMLYELLTGQRMYAAATLVGLFEMHKNAPIPKLPEQFAGHQRFLERLVAKEPGAALRERGGSVRGLDGIHDCRSGEGGDGLMGTLPFASERIRT